MRKKGSDAKAWVEVETSSAMKELADALRKEAANKEGEVEFILEPSLPGKIRLDRDFLKESFLNVFSHCKENTEKSESTFFVSGEYLEEGDYTLRISVSESIGGFSKEELECLSERKDNCPEAYLSKLYAIRKGARDRGGGFYVYSTDGGGTIYYMILPCKVLSSVTVAELEEMKSSLHNTPSEEGKTEEKQLESGWIDRKLALNYAGDMEEMRLELLNIYFEQAQQYLKELPELFKAEDWKGYRIMVHAIKGNSLGIGAQGFSEEAYEQEMAARDGDIDKIKTEFADFYSHYQSLTAEVKNSIIR